LLRLLNVDRKTGGGLGNARQRPKCMAKLIKDRPGLVTDQEKNEIVEILKAAIGPCDKRNLRVGEGTTTYRSKISQRRVSPPGGGITGASISTHRSGARDRAGSSVCAVPRSARRRPASVQPIAFASSRTARRYSARACSVVSGLPASNSVMTIARCHPSKRAGADSRIAEDGKQRAHRLRAGADPVDLGVVKNIARPGGRFFQGLWMWNGSVHRLLVFSDRLLQDLG
jgi:hypothetical protein